MKHALRWFRIALCVFPLILSIVVYPFAPEIIPLHIGVNGEPDDYGPKSNLVVFGVLFAVMCIVFYLIMKQLKKKYPNENHGQRAELFDTLGTLIAVALNVVFAIVIANIFNMSFVRYLLPIIAVAVLLLIFYLGLEIFHGRLVFLIPQLHFPVKINEMEPNERTCIEHKVGSLLMVAAVVFALAIIVVLTFGQ